MKKSVVFLTGFTLLGLTSLGSAQTTSSTISSNAATTKATTTMQTSPAQANLQAGQAFLAANKNQPGVVTLPSGLQYKVIDPGNGANPSPQDIVTVDYEGKLLNGQIFDSSYKRGQPATFPVNAVIAGWQQALPLMKTGATWELYIPSSLAYGAQGAPGVIGPNETLIFKVHLISIQKANSN